MTRIKIDTRGLKKLQQDFKNTACDLKKLDGQRFQISAQTEEEVARKAEKLVADEINKIFRKNFR